MRTKKRSTTGYVRSYKGVHPSSDSHIHRSANMEVCVETFSEDIHRACLDAVPVKVTMTWLSHPRRRLSGVVSHYVITQDAQGNPRMQRKNDEER